MVRSLALDDAKTYELHSVRSHLMDHHSLAIWIGNLNQSPDHPVEQEVLVVRPLKNKDQQIKRQVRPIDIPTIDRVTNGEMSLARHLRYTASLLMASPYLVVSNGSPNRMAPFQAVHVARFYGLRSVQTLALVHHCLG